MSLLGFAWDELDLFLTVSMGWHVGGLRNQHQMSGKRGRTGVGSGASSRDWLFSSKESEGVQA
jgi:hypothetical protein